MHTTNYFDTLILPSPDCSAKSAMVPGKPGSIAALQYERLACHPYGTTSDTLLFDVHAERQGIAQADRAPAREAYFSKGQACLRASPLVKNLGWALHHDANGLVALVDPASARFAELRDRQDIAKLAGMRSRRA